MTLTSQERERLREVELRRQLKLTDELLAQWGWVEGSVPEDWDTREVGDNIEINMVPTFLKQRAKLISALEQLKIYSGT